MRDETSRGTYDLFTAALLRVLLTWFLSRPLLYGIKSWRFMSRERFVSLFLAFLKFVPSKPPLSGRPLVKDFWAVL